MDPRYAHFRNFSGGDLSPAEKRRIWLEISDMTAEEFDAMIAAQQARQANAPRAGDMAPDFELERITPERRLTGETVRLSSLRGRPVALAFGSYT